MATGIETPAMNLLTRSGLAFRSHDESESSNCKGSYLTSLEYPAEFDDFIKCLLENDQCALVLQIRFKVRDDGILIVIDFLDVIHDPVII
jgi:hypothetical protein